MSATETKKRNGQGGSAAARGKAPPATAPEPGELTTPTMDSSADLAFVQLVHHRLDGGCDATLLVLPVAVTCEADLAALRADLGRCAAGAVQRFANAIRIDAGAVEAARDAAGSSADVGDGDDEGGDGEEDGDEDGDGDVSLEEALASQPGEPVDMEAVAEATLVEVFRARRQCESVNQTICDRLRMAFCFDSDGDFGVAAQAVRADLAEVAERLEELETQLCKWFGDVAHGWISVVALNAADLGAAVRLRRFMPLGRANWLPQIMSAALQHLVDDPGADAALAACERAGETEWWKTRMEKPVPPAKLGYWPFRKLDGSAWDALAPAPRVAASTGVRQQGSPDAPAEHPSPQSKPNRPNVPGRGRRGKAARPEPRFVISN